MSHYRTMNLFNATLWLVYLQMGRIWMKWSPFIFTPQVDMGLREAMTSFLCVPRTVLIWSQTSVSHWRRQSIHENVTVSTMGLPFFLSCSQESHTQAFSFFLKQWLITTRALAWRSHIVSMFECVLNSGSEVISSAQQHVWCLFVALEPRLNTDIMANFGLQYNTSWFSRELTWWNIR